MDKNTIEASLSRVDRTFLQDLTPEERRKAYEDFRRIYAEEMSKVAFKMERQKRISENIAQLGMQEEREAIKIDEDMRAKMDKHRSQRQRLRDKKLTSMKQLDENWRGKIESIVRANKERAHESHRKAQQFRKAAEEFWDRKSVSQHGQSRILSSGFSHPQEQRESPEKNPTNTAQGMSRSLLPSVIRKRTRASTGQNYTFMNATDKDEEIKRHIELSHKKKQEREAHVFQKAMEKLKKITDTRINVQKKVEKQIKESKQIKELRYGAEARALRKERSKALLEGKMNSSRTPQVSKMQESPTRSFLGESIVRHLESKRRIEEQEFNQRGQMLQGTMRRLKNGKINRMVREAVSLLKYETLKE